MEQCLQSPLSSQAPAATVPGRMVAAATAWQVLREAIDQAASRRRQRRALARLDDHLLDDIGLSREQARREAGKPFWR